MSAAQDKEIEKKQTLVTKAKSGFAVLKRLNPIPRIKRKKATQPELIGKDDKAEVKEGKKKPNFVSWLWRIVLFAATVFVVAVIVFGIGIYAFGWQDKVTKTVYKIIPYPAVLVNLSQLVRYSAYENEVDYIKKVYTADSAGADKIDLSTADGQKKLNDYKTKIVEYLIENQVIESVAAHYKVTATDTEIDHLYSQYETILGKEKMAEIPDVRNKIRVNVLMNNLEDKVIVQIRVRQIMIKSQPTDDQTKQDEARARAEALLVQLKAGANFEELAKANSEDTGSKDVGGDLGFFSRGKSASVYGQAFEDAAFALKVGEISNVIKSDVGLHILKLEERKGQVDKELKAWLQEEKIKAITWRFVK